MAEVFVGIDVSKNTLEIAIWPGTEAWQLANAEHELKGLIARLQVLAPALVVLEASGQLHRPIAEALAIAGFACAVMNPRPARDFAKATGKLAKTDKLDARPGAVCGDSPPDAKTAAGCSNPAPGGLEGTPSAADVDDRQRALSSTDQPA